MATYGPHKLTRDKGLMSRMYLTMFLMGILYAAFVLILWSSGVGIIFVGIIAGVILAIQYFMSEKLVLRSTGAMNRISIDRPARSISLCGSCCCSA